MAVVFDPNKDEEENSQQTQDQQEDISSSQESALSGGGGLTPPSQNPNKTPKGSGRFVNIQNYLKGNKSDATANKITGAVQKQTQQAQTQTDESKNAYTTAQQGEKTRLTDIQNKAQSSLNDLGSTQSEEDIKQNIQAGMNAQYQGPQGVNNTQSLMSKQQSLNDINNAAQSEGGQRALLEKFTKRPTTTAGALNLDQLLLQNSKQGQAALNDARTQSRTVGRNIQQLLDTSANEINQARQGAQQFGTDFSNQVQQKATDTEADLVQRAQAKQAALQADAANVSTEEAIQTLTSSGFNVVAGPNGAPAVKFGNSYVPVANLIPSIAGNIQGEFTAGNIDPAAAAKFNVLADILGKNRLDPSVQAGALNNQLNQGAKQNLDTFNQQMTQNQEALDRYGAATQGQVLTQDQGLLNIVESDPVAFISGAEQGSRNYREILNAIMTPQERANLQRGYGVDPNTGQLVISGRGSPDKNAYRQWAQYLANTNRATQQKTLATHQAQREAAKRTFANTYGIPMEYLV